MAFQNTLQYVSTLPKESTLSAYLFLNVEGPLVLFLHLSVDTLTETLFPGFYMSCISVLAERYVYGYISVSVHVHIYVKGKIQNLENMK